VRREEKIKVVKLLFNEIFDKGNVELVDKIIHKDYFRNIKEFKDSTSQYIVKQEYRKQGRDGFKEWIKAINKSFTDGIIEINHTLENIIVENDTVAVQYFINWKQRKASDDLAVLPFNKPVEFKFVGSHFIEFKDNKIIKLIAIWDSLTMALNLGSVIMDQDDSQKFKDYIHNLRKMGLLPT
jgi:predicted ester cyclase